MTLTVTGAPGTLAVAAATVPVTDDAGTVFAALLGALPQDGRPTGTPSSVPLASVDGTIAWDTGADTTEGAPPPEPAVPEPAAVTPPWETLPLALLAVLVPPVAPSSAAQAPALGAPPAATAVPAAGSAPAVPVTSAPLVSAPLTGAPLTGAPLPAGFTPVSEAEAVLLAPVALLTGPAQPAPVAADPTPRDPTPLGTTPREPGALDLQLLDLGQPGAPTPPPATAPAAPTPTPPPTTAAAPPAPPAPVHHQVATALLGVRSQGEGTHQLQLALHPAELGQVNVHVRMVDGAMSIALASGSDSTLDSLRAALPELRAELRAAGLAQVTLSLDLADPGAPNHQPGTDRWVEQPPSPWYSAAPDPHAREPDTPRGRTPTTALDRLL